MAVRLSSLALAVLTYLSFVSPVPAKIRECLDGINPTAFSVLAREETLLVAPVVRPILRRPRLKPVPDSTCFTLLITDPRLTPRLCLGDTLVVSGLDVSCASDDLGVVVSRTRRCVLAIGVVRLMDRYVECQGNAFPYSAIALHRVQAIRPGRLTDHRETWSANTVHHHPSSVVR